MIDIQTLLESEGIYRTQVEQWSLNWRLLSIKEYQLFRKLRDSEVLPDLTVYNLVFERCFVGNPQTLPDAIYAGIPISIGQLIMHLSGDCEATSLRDEIEAAREAFPGDSVYRYMERIIQLAMPSYTPDDIVKWTRPKFFERFTNAEQMLKQRFEKYEFLDTRKITLPGESSKSSKKGGVDFEKENALLDQKLGWKEKQEWEAPRSVTQPLPPTPKLTPEQAKKLERRHNKKR